MGAHPVVYARVQLSLVRNNDPPRSKLHRKSRLNRIESIDNVVGISFFKSTAQISRPMPDEIHMSSPENKNDWLTIAAVAVMAMCLVTFDHEALGHGSACLLLHGHIVLLSSSIFRCSVRSDWIDPAGPLANLLMGTLALLCLRLVPRATAHAATIPDPHYRVQLFLGVRLPYPRHAPALWRSIFLRGIPSGPCHASGSAPSPLLSG